MQERNAGAIYKARSLLLRLDEEPTKAVIPETYNIQAFSLASGISKLFSCVLVLRAHASSLAFVPSREFLALHSFALPFLQYKMTKFVRELTNSLSQHSPFTAPSLHLLPTWATTITYRSRGASFWLHLRLPLHSLRPRQVAANARYLRLDLYANFLRLLPYHDGSTCTSPSFINLFL